MTRSSHQQEATGDVLSEVVKWALLGHISEIGVTVEAGQAIRAAVSGVPSAAAPAPEEATTDQLLQLAGALEQRRGLAIVDAVTALSTGYHEGAFRAGYETACEEITLRLRTEVWENCLPPVDAPKDGAGEVKRG